MPRNLRTAILLSMIAMGSVALFGWPADAATVPGCTNPADSALNQYCEVIPASLPRGTLNRIARGFGPQARAARALLTLPPAHPSVSTRETPVSRASPSSLPLWLLIALAALALALLGMALAGRGRRLQQDSAPPADVPT